MTIGKNTEKNLTNQLIELKLELIDVKKKLEKTNINYISLENLIQEYENELNDSK